MDAAEDRFVDRDGRRMEIIEEEALSSRNVTNEK